MYGKNKLVITLLILSSMDNFALANPPDPTISPEPPSCAPPPPLELHINPIFNESDPDILTIHRWANWMHIDTKPITIIDASAFFIELCEPTAQDRDELERHLRSRQYLREAKVTEDPQTHKTIVSTWDNWSLLPTASFGRSGGKNKVSVGVKDRNFLGLGIDTHLSYFSNVQRSGYRVSSQIPLFLKNNSQLDAMFTDTEDGQQYSLFLNKLFASQHTDSAYEFGFNQEQRQDHIFQNNADKYSFDHDIQYWTANWGKRLFSSNQQVLRYRLGVTQDKHIFAPLMVEKVAENPTTTDEDRWYAPANRNFVYPWLAMHWFEQDFRQLRNVRLINATEDFNFGWEIESKLGFPIAAYSDEGTNSAALLWQLTLKKNVALSDNALLAFQAEIESTQYHHGNDSYAVTLETEYYYTLNEKWRFYAENKTVFSTNQYRDIPVTMGDDSGLRGYPLQYQHGDNSYLFSLETRYYPQINLFKLFELGGSIFWDIGKASGNSSASPFDNVESGWLQAIGIGARFYSTHSSEQQVIHVDLTHPLSNNPNIHGIDLRISTKHSF